MNTVAADLNNLLKPDKEWFDSHPDRKYRFRSMTPEEQLAFPGPDSISLHILDGAEVLGMPLLFGCPHSEDIDDERFARLIFNYAIQLQEPDVKPFEAQNKALFAEANHGKA